MKNTIKIGCVNEDELRNKVKNQKVVIYGIGADARGLFKTFKRINVEVLGFCLKKDRMSFLARLQLIWIKLNYNGANIFDENEMDEIAKKYEGLYLIENPRDETEKKYGFREEKVYRIPGGRAKVSFLDQYYIQRLKTCTMYRVKEELLWKHLCTQTDSKGYRQFRKNNDNKSVYLCLPSKTADHTLKHTFSALHVPFYNLGHKIRFFKQIKNNKQVKIITALREPISQNISLFYQVVGTGMIHKNIVMGELYRTKKHKKKQVLEKYEHKFVECADDAQAFFNLFIQQYYPNEGLANRSVADFCIQEFFDDFAKEIIDITQYPFDQEKGYTIIKNGGLEIFVYQLEKLNDLVPELSEWVGVPFDKLEEGNVGENKWIGESYKQALREIEITQEYFDRCYAEPYVQHCYSQADIQTFKARWRTHIKKEGFNYI